MREAEIIQFLHRINIHDADTTRVGWVNSTCPLAPWTHASGVDRNPSFGVKVENTKNSGYKCFSCGEHGRFSGLFRRIAYLSGDDNLNTIAQQVEAAERKSFKFDDFDAIPAVDMTPPKPIVEEAFIGIYNPVSGYPEAMQYLSSRNIGQATAEKLGLLWDEQARRIMFPVRDKEQRLYGWTGRTVIPNHQPKIKDYEGLPKRKLLLGEHLWKGLPLLVVEGLFGYGHLFEISADRYFDIAATMGAELHPQQLTRIRHHPSSRAYMLYDNDEAGAKGLFGTVDPRTEKRRIENGAVWALHREVSTYVPSWPEGKSDPDELTIKDIEKIYSESRAVMGPQLQAMMAQSTERRGKKS